MIWADCGRGFALAASESRGNSRRSRRRRRRTHGDDLDYDTNVVEVYKYDSTIVIH